MNAKPNSVVASGEGVPVGTADLAQLLVLRSVGQRVRQDAATLGHCYGLLPIGHNLSL